MPPTQQRVFTVERRGAHPLKRRRGDDVVDDKVLLATQIDDMLSAIERLETRVSAIADVLPDGSAGGHHLVADQIPGNTRSTDATATDWGDIADELTQVVQTTEKATEDILDASEAIDSIAGDLIDIMAEDEPNDDVVSMIERIRGLTAQIFQAASFQDLTGQRITKVTRIVQSIEDRVGQIEHNLQGGGSKVSSQDDHSALDPSDPHFNETTLLNGPAKEGQGISQEEIDQLF